MRRTVARLAVALACATPPAMADDGSDALGACLDHRAAGAPSAQVIADCEAAVAALIASGPAPDAFEVSETTRILTLAYLETDNLVGAAAAQMRAALLVPDDPAPIAWLGDIMVQAGRPKLGRAMADAVLEMEEAHFHLPRVWQIRTFAACLDGDSRSAAQAFSVLLSVGPDLARIRRAILARMTETGHFSGRVAEDAGFDSQAIAALERWFDDEGCVVMATEFYGRPLPDRPRNGASGRQAD